MTHYDDEGNPVIAVAPRFPGDEPEAIADASLLETILSQFIDDSPAEAIGQRFVVLAYLMQIPGAPRSQRSLARKLGVSVGKVNGIFQRIRKEIRMELMDFYQNPERSAHR